MARSEGGSSAPLEATRGRGSGWPLRPERAPVTTRISESSCGRESLSVNVCTIHSDKHYAKHGVRSGSEQLPVRNEMTKPGASSFINNLKRTGPVCERSEMKEHRTRGGADGMEWRRTFRAVAFFKTP